MSDFSMDRLEPTARTTPVQRQPQRDKPSRPRRRPGRPSRSPGEEPPQDSEDQSHQVDRLA